MAASPAALPGWPGGHLQADARRPRQAYGRPSSGGGAGRGRAGRRRGRSGRGGRGCGTVGGFRLGGFSGRRGRPWFRPRRGIVFPAAIVVDIPAGALEVEARRGEQALERAVALGALGQRLGGEILNFFEAMAALGAAIGIQRQGADPFGETIPTLPIVSAGRQWRCDRRPAG